MKCLQDFLKNRAEKIMNTVATPAVEVVLEVAVETAPEAAPVPSAPEEEVFRAYVTGYGYTDNTPPSREISNPVVHNEAGGEGTFRDPITVAVGHQKLGAMDLLDYVAGTKFYIPAFRRYFVVEDTCGDGPTPQNGPCHCGFEGLPWLDVWCGGDQHNGDHTLQVEDAITGKWLVIQNPKDSYPVVAGEMDGVTFKDEMP